MSLQQAVDEFFDALIACPDEPSLIDFCRRRVLHGTPFVFQNREDDFYEFRKRIADRFEINFHDVFITGSGKLGFSPHKRRAFDLDSDIDVAIISGQLFEHYMKLAREYQYSLRDNRFTVTQQEMKQYHRFLEYVALGWLRPDLIPTSFKMDVFRQEWFDFFASISYGKSEVGNYKVSSGVFKNYECIERYTADGLRKLAEALRMEKRDGAAN